MAAAKAGFDELLVQLRTTNALLVDVMQQQFQLKQNDIIIRLHKIGMSNGEIALVVGTSLGTVGVTLSRGKKKAGK